MKLKFDQNSDITTNLIDDVLGISLIFFFVYTLEVIFFV